MPDPRSFTLRLALLLAVWACDGQGRVAPAAPPPAAAVVPHRAAAGFGGPRDPARPADPARIDGAVVIEMPTRAEPLGPVLSTPQVLPALLAELQRNAGHVQRCWDRRAAGVTGGRLTIHAELDADGLVVEQCLTEDTVGDAALQRCANELVAMGRYPVGDEAPVHVVFSLRLGPPAGQAG